MRKLQNPPTAGEGPKPPVPEQPRNAPSVWRAALLVASALVLKPGTANAQSACQNFQYGSLNSSLACLYELDQARMARENLARDERNRRVNEERERLKEKLPSILAQAIVALDEVKVNLSAIRLALQSELSDGTETGKKIAAIKIELLDTASSLISRMEHSLNFDMMFQTIMSSEFGVLQYNIDGSFQYVHLENTDISGLDSSPFVSPEALFYSSRFSSLNSISQFVTEIRSITDAFKLINVLSPLMTAEEQASFYDMADSFRSLEGEYTEEMRVLVSNYILRGPLSMLSTPDMLKVQDYAIGTVQRSVFLASTPADQASEISEILSEVGIEPEIGAPLASAAAVLLRISTDRSATQDVVSSMYSPTDARTMMDSASSFLTTEEITAFKIFLGLEQPPAPPPAQPVQINPDDCSNPFMLATNFIFQGPLARLDGYSKEMVISYLMGNISRIMDGPASSFSGLSLMRQSGVIMRTVRELELDVGMDVTQASVAAVLSHIGMQRGASPEVMQAINSPTGAEAMMNAADSFLTPEEAADFRGLFGIAQPASVSTLSP